MIKLVFEGRETGMRKVSFTFLLYKKAGLSVAEAKYTTDRILDNEQREIEIKDDALAKHILKKSRELGIKTKLVAD